jgi:hypothetical protein
MREKAPVQFGAATESASPSVEKTTTRDLARYRDVTEVAVDKSIATSAMVAIVAASCYRRPYGNLTNDFTHRSAAGAPNLP